MHATAHRLYLAGMALGEAADRILRREFAIGFTDYLALVGTKKGLEAQAQLAPHIGLSDAGVSRTVSRLTERGFLRASEDKSNRRRSILVLTSEGERILSDAQALLERHFRELAGQVLTSGELDQLTHVLDALLQRLSRKVFETGSVNKADEAFNQR